ncbi:TonB-dependent receptor [Membranihabitans maritimus]|uniref:TonB-dependent receptor n=1 Tax=Membranihabitans maritimus TaxID=2904244 RepID=UPI001F1AC816|nr:TonB-dependent receptor [Membranihabitans maritimus]
MIYRLTTLTVALLLFCSLAFSQNNGSISGTLITGDNNEPLPFATISVYTAIDTVILDYALSNDDGSFEIKRLPFDKDLRMIISFLGYEPVKEVFQLTEDIPDKNFETIILKTSAKRLDEVLIEAERPPVVIKKDTVEFNAGSFQTRDGATVEDLVKKLPGVVVDNQGNITVDGRAVNKIRVDGNEFFGGDPRIALRNLTSDMIDKVQISDDREEDPQQLLADDEVGKVINLKLKKDAKIKAFGKAYAGAGTKDRFEVGGILNSFRDTFQVSLLGYFNNLKKTNLSMEEVLSMGGFNDRWARGGGDGAFSINGIDFGAGGEGYPRSLMGGTNVNAQFGEARLNLQYFYSQNRLETESQTFTEQNITNDSTFYYESSNSGNSKSDGHNIGGGLRWELDTTSRINFNVNLNFSNGQNPNTNVESSAFEDPDNILQSFTTEEDPKSSNMSFSSRLFYNKELNPEGRNISVRGSFSRSNNNNDLLSNFQRYYFENAADSAVYFDQLRTQYTNNQSMDISFDYTEPLFENFFLELSGDYEPTIRNNNITTEQQFDNQTNWEYVDLLSNDFERNEQEYELGAGFRYQKEKLQISANLDYQILDYTNSFGKEIADFTESYRFFSPRFRIVLDGWRFSYRYDFDVPDINQLHPITDNTNPLNIREGNPNLQPTKGHDIYVSKFSFQGKWRYNMFLRGSVENNPIINTSFVDNSGVTVRRPINYDGDATSFYGSAGLSRTMDIEGHKINSDLRLYSGLSRSPFMINGQDGLSKNSYVGMNLRFNYSFKDIMDFAPSYSINFNKTRYDGNTNYRNVDITTHNLAGNFTFHLPWNFEFVNDISYRYNPQVAPGFQKSTVLWHAAINKKILESKKAIIRLSVYDLLDQNISVYRHVNYNSIVDRQQLTLRRYFMLSFIYDFSQGNKNPMGDDRRGYRRWRR